MPSRRVNTPIGLCHRLKYKLLRTCVTRQTAKRRGLRAACESFASTDCYFSAQVRPCRADYIIMTTVSRANSVIKLLYNSIINLSMFNTA